MTTPCQSILTITTTCTFCLNCIFSTRSSGVLRKFSDEKECPAQKRMKSTTAFYLQINLCQIQINLYQILINLYQIQINLCQIQINLNQIQINLYQIQIYLCQIQINLCQIQINLCQIQINLSQIQINLYQIQINSSQIQINISLIVIAKLIMKAEIQCLSNYVLPMRSWSGITNITSFLQ